jgi:hypothetical protein
MVFAIYEDDETATRKENGLSDLFEVMLDCITILS